MDFLDSRLRGNDKKEGLYTFYDITMLRSPGLIHVLLVALVLALLTIPLHGAELKLIPQLSLRGQSNDNIFLDATNKYKIHDYTTYISPSLRLTDRTERLNASIESRLDRIEYLDQKDLDATDQYHSGRIGYLVTPQMNVSADAGYTRDSQADRDIETTGLVLGTAIRRRQHYAGSSSAALSEITSVNVSYSYDEDKFESPKYTDSRSQDMSLTLARNLDALLSETIGRISAGYTLYDYPSAEVTDYSMMIGASRKITETLDLSADLGEHIERTRNELFHIFVERDKTRGGIGQASLNYRGELSAASASYIQDIRSISGGVGVSRYSSLRFNLSRRFTYELTGELMAEYYLNKQNKKEIIWWTKIDQETYRIQPRLVYNLTNDLRLETSYRFIRRKDNESDQRYAQNLFSLGLTWQYPIPH